MQNAVDVDRGHGGALERRKEDAAQRIAQRRAEATLQRLGHEGGDAAAVTARLHIELRRTDQFLPVLLVDLHLFVLPVENPPPSGEPCFHKDNDEPPGKCAREQRG